MTAKEMFEKLGFNLIGDDVYTRKNDFEEISIFFNKELFPKTYDVLYMDWIENKQADWIPMDKRKKDIKHCSAYGHWQKENYPIGMELHKAIHKRCDELGWLDD